MKKLIFLIVFLISGIFYGTSANPWFKKTQHKHIKRMTSLQVADARLGRLMYERHHGKVYKATRHQWCTAKRPTNYNAWANNRKDYRKQIFKNR